MALINKTLPGLYNGVSTQSPNLVQDNQCKEQVNFIGSLSRNLEKRVGTYFLTTLASAHTTRRSYIERFTDTTNVDYVMCFNADVDNPLEIYNLTTGNKATITYEGAAKNYLLTSDLQPLDPIVDIKALSLADYTIVLNKTLACSMTPDVTSNNPLTILLWIKQTAVSSGFSLKNTSGLYIPVTAPSDNNNRTSQVAGSFVTAINADATAQAQGISAVGLGSSVVAITANNQSNYDAYVKTMYTNDDFGGNAAKLVKGTVSKVSDLPANAPANYILRVTGDETDGFSAYYMRYNDVENVWEETLAPGSSYKLEPGSMPHTLIRTGTDTFLFRPASPHATYASWIERTVGDDTSSPLPSFIGNTLSDIIVFKNRLGLISGQALVMSVSGDFFNLFPESVTVVADTDPIDIIIGADEFVDVLYGIPFKDSLMLLTDDAQFLVSSSDNIFSPNTVVSDRVTKFPCSRSCRPVSSRANAFFLSNKSGHTVVREYFVQPDSLTEDAADITSHAPDYLPNNIIKMVSVTNTDQIFFKKDVNDGILYVYKYFWIGNEKVQSAWFTYTFDYEIHGIFTIDNLLYIVASKDGVRTLDSLDTEEYDALFHLDRQYTTTSIPGDRVTITLPYSDDSTDFTVIGVESDGDYRLNLNYTRPNATTILLDNELGINITSLIIGKKYESTYTFKQFFLKDNNTGVGVIDGTLQVIKMSLSMFNSDGFDVEITTTDGSVRPPVDRNFTGAIVGRLRVNQLPLTNSRYNCRVLGRSDRINITIKQKGILPCRLAGASYEARYTSRSRLM